MHTAGKKKLVVKKEKLRTLGTAELGAVHGGKPLMDTKCCGGTKKPP